MFPPHTPSTTWPLRIYFNEPLFQIISQILQRAHVFDPRETFRRADHSRPAGREDANRAIAWHESKCRTKFRDKAGKIRERAVINAVAVHKESGCSELYEHTTRSSQTPFEFGERHELRIPIVGACEQRCIFHPHEMANALRSKDRERSRPCADSLRSCRSHTDRFSAH